VAVCGGSATSAASSTAFKLPAADFSSGFAADAECRADAGRPRDESISAATPAATAADVAAAAAIAVAEVGIGGATTDDREADELMPIPMPIPSPADHAPNCATLRSERGVLLASSPKTEVAFEPPPLGVENPECGLANEKCGLADEGKDLEGDHRALAPVNEEEAEEDAAAAPEGKSMGDGSALLYPPLIGDGGIASAVGPEANDCESEKSAAFSDRGR
jgi:hypothetical protein